MAQGAAFAMVMATATFGLYYTHRIGHAAKAAVVSDPVDLAAVAAAKARAQSSAGGWTYFDTVDRVVGDVTHHARLIGRRAQPVQEAMPAAAGHSVVTPALSATPQDGAADTAPILELTASTHYGKHIIITLPRMAKPCEPAPCILSISFDEAPPENFTYQDPSDARETVLISNEFGRLVPLLQKAHDVTLALLPATPQGDPTPTPSQSPTPTPTPSRSPLSTATFISDGLKLGGFQ
jgi:uncharacterized membrane protein